MEPKIKLTPDEYAEMMKINKPHLIEIEEKVAEVQNGEIEIRLFVRAGVVAKMAFFKTATWIKEKATT
jgi:hypothetical protein